MIQIAAAFHQNKKKGGGPYLTLWCANQKRYSLIPLRLHNELQFGQDFHPEKDQEYVIKLVTALFNLIHSSLTGTCHCGEHMDRRGSRQGPAVFGGSEQVIHSYLLFPVCKPFLALATMASPTLQEILRDSLQQRVMPSYNAIPDQLTLLDCCKQEFLVSCKSNDHASYKLNGSLFSV